jgi:hypothetical protein
MEWRLGHMQRRILFVELTSGVCLVSGGLHEPFQVNEPDLLCIRSSGREKKTGLV